MTVVSPALAAALQDRYRIERELGSGGMAIVYLAEDLKHRRRVALKVLRAELAATLGPERFIREIEVAARLQHPHILPLHDSGEAQGFLYYVMPFVDGHNLRGRVNRQGELPIHDAVKVLLEVTDALAYAHSQGVVHRDIKPENILLSGRHALVSDFGVAKAVSEATGRQALTTAGVALGTPAYMAPEQATADPLSDHRVDIYALGCLGYELLAGRPPFTGLSSHEVLAAHVTQQPEPISTFRPAVPAPLATIVMKCLAKRPADRWQTADELLTQLEQQLTPSGGVTPTQTRPMPAARSNWSAVRLAAIGALILILAAGGFLLARRHPPAGPVLGKRSALTLEPGLEMNPSVSPDGKFVAYSRMTPAESRLVVQQAAGGEPVTVARWPGLYPAMPAWSPDGSRLLYTSPRGLELVPALGGVSRLLVPQSPGTSPTGGRMSMRGWGSWAPAGDEIVYPKADTLFVQRLSDESPRVLLKIGETHSPVWSPDGKWIAYVSGNPQYPPLANLAPSSIWIVPAAGGTPVRITEDRPLHTSPVWLPDSRGLLYVSNRDGGRDIYFVPLSRSGVPAAPPTRLTTGLGPHTIGLSADGRRLVYSLLSESSNVVAVILRPGRSVSLREGRPVTTGSQQIEGFSVSPDGRWLVFDSDRNGNQDIWRMPLDRSGPPEPISAGPEDEFHPSYTADGRSVGFHATKSGSVRDLYLIPAEGGQRTRIEVQSANNLAPQFSSDGRSVLFLVWNADGSPSVHGARRQGTDSSWSRTTPLFRIPSSGSGDWSPDARSIAYGTPAGVFRADAEGKNPRQISNIPAGLTPFFFRWSTDGRWIYYSGIKLDGTYLVYRVPADGGRSVQVAHSEGSSYQNFRFSFDVRGNTLYAAVADRQSDVWISEIVGQR